MIIDKMEGDTSLNLDELKESLINHICIENKGFFKHQQKDEKDLDFTARKDVCEILLKTSHSKFLLRFGMHLNLNHLKYFELLHDYNNDEQREMITEQLKILYYNLDHKKVVIKNRRYAALKKLIEEKSYFSESEMKQRDPLLFDHLIGQYLTSDEKRARRRPDFHTDTLLDVLFEGIDHNRDCEIEKEQRRTEEESYKDEDESDESSQHSFDDESVCSKQWGNFDEQSQSEEQRPTTSKKRKRNAEVMITAAERDLLKEEFIGIMYNNFLTGKDTEFFDYSQVDTNEKYDEIQEKDQDCEDKYFDNDDDDDDNDYNNGQCSPIEKMENDEESEEDELEVYMKHIEDNSKRQKEELFQEEFDD